MVPPEEMAVAGVKAREMGTDNLPTIRSKEAIIKETDETRLEIPPDDTEFEIEQTFARNLTSTEPAVAAPIVKPLMVMVKAAAGMMAPEVVILTAVADVAPHVAVKPATLLAPDATEGITEDAKKLEGYRRVKALPERMGNEAEKTIVTETDDFPFNRSDEEMPNEIREIPVQTKSQIYSAVKEAKETGISRLVVLPSPICTKH